VHFLPWMVDVVGLLARHTRHSLLDKYLVSSLPDGRKEYEGEDDKRRRERAGADGMIEAFDNGYA
jgi:hypothetical protein